MTGRFVFDILSQVLKYDDNKVKIVFDLDGNPWFALKELLIMFGYTTFAKQTTKIKISTKNKKAYKDLNTITPLNGKGNRSVTKFINEAGLYELLNSSTKEIAIEFKNEIFNNILPQLRKTGKYIMSEDHIIKLKEINESLQNKNQKYIDELNYYYDKYKFIPSENGYIYINEVKTIHRGQNLTCYKLGYCTNMKKRKMVYKVGNFFYKLLCYIPIKIDAKKIERCCLIKFKEHILKPSKEIVCFLSLEDLKNGILECIDESIKHICHCVHCKKVYNLTDVDLHMCKKMNAINDFININMEDIIENAVELKIINQYDIIKKQARNKISMQKLKKKNHQKGGKNKNNCPDEVLNYRVIKCYVNNKTNYINLRSIYDGKTDKIKSKCESVDLENSQNISERKSRTDVLLHDTSEFDTQHRKLII